MLLCSSSLAHYAWWHRSVFSAKEKVNTLLFVQIILTIQHSAQAFVIFSVFAVHLTDDINPRSRLFHTSCSLEKSKQSQQLCFFLVAHPANQSTFSFWKIQKYPYIVLSEFYHILLNCIMVEQADLHSLFLIYCVAGAQKMEDLRSCEIHALLGHYAAYRVFHDFRA